MLLLTLIPFAYGLHTIHFRKRASFFMQIQHHFKVSQSLYFEGTFRSSVTTKLLPFPAACTMCEYA